MHLNVLRTVKCEWAQSDILVSLAFDIQCKGTRDKSCLEGSISFIHL